jgi:diaminohydroxyphosphoribosylaminopyrimidine deaminase/5-amino-6-(5-phosphoribosylamino)uracil reductase
MLTHSGISTDTSTTDEFYLDRAIDLAWLGAGKTRSNPLVGAVVVKNGTIIGEGFHAAFGSSHAESVALDQAGRLAVGATLYVTLEPCTHYGKTPPCVDRIVESGVRRVVACTLDPDPRMDGRGVEVLRSAGIEVEVGRRADPALLLNLCYFKRTLNLGGGITVKVATTWDGRIASGRGEGDVISGEESRRQVHRLRAVHGGVLVGINTVLVDEPRLDCRLLGDVAPPVPVVLDTHLRFPERYPWMDEGRRFVVVSGENAPVSRKRVIEERGGVVLQVASGEAGVDLGEALSAVVGWGLPSVLVEGGARVLTNVLDGGNWDGLHLFVSPAAFGPAGVPLVERPIHAGDAVLSRVTAFSRDVLVSYVNAKTRDAVFARVLRA